MPRRMSGPNWTLATSPQQDRHAVGADADGDLLQIIQALDVAAHAQHEFLFRHLDGTAAHLAVAALDGHGRRRQMDRL